MNRAQLDRMFEIEADPTLNATARMIVGVLNHLRTGLDEMGAPFTADQELVLADMEKQARGWPL